MSFFKLPYLAWNMSPVIWERFIITSLHSLLLDSSYFFQVTFVRNAICDIILVVYLFSRIIIYTLVKIFFFAILYKDIRDRGAPII